MKTVLVYIDFWEKDLLNPEKNADRRADCLLPWLYLKDYCKENNVILEAASKIPFEKSNRKKYLYYSFGQMDGYQRIKARKDIIFGSFYLFEPPIKVLPKPHDIYYHLNEIKSYFNRIYTTSPIDSINKSYGLGYKFNSYLFFYPQSHSSIIENLWNNRDRKTLVMVNSYRYSRFKLYEYYSERIKALNYFLYNNSIDLFGYDWHKISRNIVRNSITSILWAIKNQSLARLKDIYNSRNIREQLKAIGYSMDKYSTLSNYRYAICYESMGIDGFITEKIFDCFFSGTIPIYLGAPDIYNYVPKNTFIDKRLFKNYKELGKYLDGLDESQYNFYRQNIRDFISSKAFSPFKKESFAERFLKDVIEDSKMLEAVV